MMWKIFSFILKTILWCNVIERFWVISNHLVIVLYWLNFIRKFETNVIYKIYLPYPENYWSISSFKYIYILYFRVYVHSIQAIKTIQSVSVASSRLRSLFREFTERICVWLFWKWPSGSLSLSQQHRKSRICRSLAGPMIL